MFMRQLQAVRGDMGDMTESKSNAFNAFSSRIRASHHPYVRLLRDAFFAVTEPNLDQ
jgi:hypothetical protein